MRVHLSSQLLLAAAATATILYAGVNESGGEFGVYSANATKGTGLPGTFGVEYAFINTSTVDIYAQQDKINVFRVAFLLERMCPVATGLGATFDETYYGHFEDAINHITVNNSEQPKALSMRDYELTAQAPMRCWTRTTTCATTTRPSSPRPAA
jgi:hypothetical protein